MWSHCGRNTHVCYNENNSECEQVHEHKWKWELVSCQHVHAWERVLVCVRVYVSMLMCGIHLFYSFISFFSRQASFSLWYLSDMYSSLHLLFLSISFLFFSSLYRYRAAIVETYIILLLYWNLGSHTYIYLHLFTYLGRHTRKATWKKPYTLLSCEFTFDIGSS